MSRLLYPGEKIPRYSLDKTLPAEKSFSCTCRKLKHGRSARRYKDWAIPALLLPSMRLIKEFSFLQLLSLVTLVHVSLAYLIAGLRNSIHALLVLCASQISLSRRSWEWDIYRNCPRSVTHATWGLSICLAGFMRLLFRPGIFVTIQISLHSV
jgi:hypothetical protein